MINKKKILVVGKGKKEKELERETVSVHSITVYMQEMIYPKVLKWVEKDGKEEEEKKNKKKYVLSISVLCEAGIKVVFYGLKGSGKLFRGEVGWDRGNEKGVACGDVLAIHFVGT